VYADLVYRVEGDVVSTDRAFVNFVAGLASRLDELVLFGRLDPKPGRAPYALPSARVRLVPLPHYPSLADLGGLARSLRSARAAFTDELDRLDAVWLFGPHPLALLFARLARRRGKPVFLGVRQDFPRYVAGRLPSRRWAWAVPAAHGLEQAFRRLARSAPAVVVGEETAARYRGGAPVLTTGFSLIRADELVSVETALAKPWTSDLRLLSVGRLDPEKNPLLLPEILALLEGRWRLDIVGEGPLGPAVEARAGELGVADRLRLLGYVPNGPRLWEEYRRSHAFLHVSLTEGLPQVLFEAQASGIPIPATDVGGVSAALDGGKGGLLVPARDAKAAAEAVERLTDPELRERLIRAGLENASRETLDAQLDRVAEFLLSNTARLEP
jgi:glycosyltransferase involved in cell wall biosynthesis